MTIIEKTNFVNMNYFDKQRVYSASALQDESNGGNDGVIACVFKNHVILKMAKMNEKGPCLRTHISVHIGLIGKATTALRIIRRDASNGV